LFQLFEPFGSKILRLFVGADFLNFTIGQVKTPGAAEFLVAIFLDLFYSDSNYKTYFNFPFI